MALSPSSITIVIAQRLRCMFPRLRVIEQRKGDIDNAIEQALSALGDEDHFAGIACLVGEPLMTPETGDSPGGEMIVTLPIELHERPLFNDDIGIGGAGGSGITAVAWAARVMEGLHHFQLGHLRGQPTLYMAGQTGQPIATADEGDVGYRVELRCALSLFDGRKCSTPTTAQDGDTLVITAQPSNARLYYITSDNYAVWPVLPGPAVPGAVLYTEPVALPSAGMAIIVVAYGPGNVRGWLPSDSVGVQCKPADALTDADGEFITDDDGSIFGLSN